MNKKHILYITYDGLTDFLGQSQVLPYIMGLEKEGYRFSILSYEKDQKFPSERKVVDDLIAGLDITWYPKKYHKRFSILATIWDVFVGILFLYKLKSKDRFDGVHCRSYISAMIGLYSKKIFKTKFIFDMRGFWADERVDGGLWNLKNPIFRLVYMTFKWLEKKYLTEADGIVSLTYNGAEEIKSWEYISSNINMHIIPCCADLNLFNSRSVNESITQKLGIQNKTVLSYLGSIGTWYMIEDMMDFYLEFRNCVLNPVFLFITGESRETILTYSRAKGISDEEIVSVKAKRNEVPSYISLSKYSVFFIMPSYSKKSSSPTKMAEILAMGIPIITNNKVGDIDIYIETNNVGAVIKDFNPAEYKRALNIVMNGVSSNPCIELAMNEFSLKQGVLKYLALYKSINL